MAKGACVEGMILCADNIQRSYQFCPVTRLSMFRHFSLTASSLQLNELQKQLCFLERGWKQWSSCSWSGLEKKRKKEEAGGVL